MHTRVMGKTGLEVSVVGFGGASLADGEPATATRLLNELLDAGVRLIDTAACYGRSEELIGQAVAHRRKEFVLVSKCGHHEVLPDGRWRSRAISMADVDLALRRLRTDCLDVMLLHSYDRAPLEQGDALGVLVAARQAGKIRFLGYSGDNQTAAYAAGLPDVAVIETSVSLVDQANVETVLPVTRHNAVGVQTKRSVANAAWRSLASGAAEDPHHQPYVDRLRAMGITPESLGVAGMPWAELALRFVLSVEGIHAALIGTANPAKIRENLAYAAKGPLPPELVARIRAAFGEARQASGTDWPGLN